MCHTVLNICMLWSHLHSPSLCVSQFKVLSDIADGHRRKKDDSGSSLQPNQPKVLQEQKLNGEMYPRIVRKPSCTRNKELVFHSRGTPWCVMLLYSQGRCWLFSPILAERLHINKTLLAHGCIPARKPADVHGVELLAADSYNKI